MVFGSSLRPPFSLRLKYSTETFQSAARLGAWEDSPARKNMRKKQRRPNDERVIYYDGNACHQLAGAEEKMVTPGLTDKPTFFVL